MDEQNDVLIGAVERDPGQDQVIAVGVAAQIGSDLLEVWGVEGALGDLMEVGRADIVGTLRALQRVLDRVGQELIACQSGGEHGARSLRSEIADQHLLPVGNMVVIRRAEDVLLGRIINLDKITYPIV